MKRQVLKFGYFSLSLGLLIAAFTVPMSVFARWDCETVGEWPCEFDRLNLDCVGNDPADCYCILVNCYFTPSNVGPNE